MGKIRLDKCREGGVYSVSGVFGGDKSTRRLLDLGFVRGARLKVVKVAPLKKIFLIHMYGALLSLRDGAAAMIEAEECPFSYPL